MECPADPVKQALGERQDAKNAKIGQPDVSHSCSVSSTRLSWNTIKHGDQRVDIVGSEAIGALEKCTPEPSAACEVGLLQVNSNRGWEIRGTEPSVLHR